MRYINNPIYHPNPRSLRTELRLSPKLLAHDIRFYQYIHSYHNMKFTSVALAGAALGLAHANPIAKRAITDGMLDLRNFYNIPR